MSDHSISMAQAIAKTSKYRSDKESILLEGKRESGIMPICETFAREAFDDLLAISGCESIRAYFSMDANQKLNLIFVAVNSSDEDILPINELPSTVTDMVVQDAIRCPTACPPESALNSD